MKLNQRGIGKIEIIVMILVLCVLGGLAYYSYDSTQKRKRDEARIQTVHDVYQSLLAYLYQENKMPENMVKGELICNDSPRFLKKLIEKKLITTIPNDPTNKPRRLCYYDYGPNNKFGAVVGVKVEDPGTQNVCFIEGAAEGTPSWCHNGYYCLCQPYKIEFK